MTTFDIDMTELVGWLGTVSEMALELYRQITAHGIAFDLKSDASPVTAADRAVEAFLVERVRARYPDHGILAEEGGRATAAAGTLWAIDPIDGTRAFATGLPGWAISVGILQDGRPVAGAVALPATGETVWTLGDEVYRSGVRLLPRPPVPPDHPLAFLAAPSNAHRHFDIDMPRVRSLGSTAVHMLYVAEGLAAAALLRRVSLWDLAGALPILERLECAVEYLSGAPFDAGALLEGALTPEPLLVTHRTQMAAVRAQIRTRPHQAAPLFGRA